MFGDEVALDLGHLTLEQREALEKKVLNGAADKVQAGGTFAYAEDSQETNV